MITLAIDFSTERRSVCVMDPGGRLARASAHDRRVGAVGLIEGTLKEAGVGRGEIDRIALGLGPGSYTGIRSAIAIAQGWSLVRKVDLVGVSSVDVMARSVDLEGDFEVLVDAQRGEFYRARYRRSGAGIEQLLGLELVSRDGVSGDLPRFSPEPEKLGSGVSALFPDAEALAKLAMEAKPAPAEELAPIYLRPVEFRKAPPPRSLG